MAGVEDSGELQPHRNPPSVHWTDPVPWARPVWIVLHDASTGLFRHDGIMVASAISYSLIFGLFPFVIFLISLGAVFGGAGLADFISREALAALPRHIVQTIEPELNRIFAVDGQARPLTFSLLLTLGSITGSVEAIRDGLNRAYGCAETRHMFRRYASSVVFVFAGMAFIITTAGLGIVVPIGMEIVHRYFPELEFEVGLFEIGRQILLVIVMALMLLAFHLLLPARRRNLKSVGSGVLLTLLGWMLAGKLFGLYLSRFANYTATYAGLAGIVVLMFFLYIQAIIFLYGAELNRSIADFRGTALCRKDN